MYPSALAARRKENAACSYETYGQLVMLDGNNSAVNLDRHATM